MASHEYDIENLLASTVISVRQRECLELLKKLGTIKDTAAALGINKRTLQSTLRRAKKLAMKDELDTRIADGQELKATSTLYKVDEETGNKIEVMQWVKTKVENNELESIKRYTEKLASVVIGCEAATPPVIAETSLMVVYVNTDLHLGQYSWDKETGNNVNAEIVYNNTIKANNILLATTPIAETGVLVDLGDTLHSSTDANRTKSGHELDVDTRHARIFEMLVDMKIKMIDSLLRKHKTVKYVTVAGNHSDLVCHYIVAMLKAYYRNEPRFAVDENVALHKYLRFGETLLGFHHGHTTPMAKLPEVMVYDRKKDISKTSYRYWLTGHVHKDSVIDNPIARVESFRNNTRNDAWAQGAGYRGNKQTVAITYHEKYGEVNRAIVPISMVESN